METDVQIAILKYLKENKSANTFKLARNLGIDRTRLVRELVKLQEKGLIEHRTGMARLLSRPKPEALRPEEPKPVKKISKPITERPRIKKQILSVNIKMTEENKKLREKLSHMENQLQKAMNSQAAYVEDLETQVQRLKRKAVALKPEIIRKKPAAGPSWLSNLNQNISQLSIPEVFKQKIELKRISLDFGKLKENISQLEIPDVLKKGW